MHKLILTLGGATALLVGTAATAQTVSAGASTAPGVIAGAPPSTNAGATTAAQQPGSVLPGAASVIPNPSIPRMSTPSGSAAGQYGADTAAQAPYTSPYGSPANPTVNGSTYPGARYEAPKQPSTAPAGRSTGPNTTGPTSSFPTDPNMNDGVAGAPGFLPN